MRTTSPRISNSAPNDAAVSPLPSEETTPPVTKIYFTGKQVEGGRFNRARKSWETLTPCSHASPDGSPGPARPPSRHQQPHRPEQSANQDRKQQQPERPLEQLHQNPNRERGQQRADEDHEPGRIRAQVDEI